MPKRLPKNIVKFAGLSSYIIATLGVILLVNFFAARFFLRFDLTAEGRYSLNQASKDIVANLDDIVTVKVFFSQEIPQLQFLSTYLTDTLEEYRAHSRGNFEYAIIDPAKSPDKKREALNLGIRPNQLQVRTSEGMTLTEVYMGLALYYQDKVEIIPQITDTKFEYDLSSAIKKMTSPKDYKLYLSIGNGEYSEGESYAALISELQKIYQVEQIDLESQGSILTKNDLVLVGGAKKPLSKDEIYYLDQHLVKGGKVMLLLDSLVSGATPILADSGLNEFLKGLGIKHKAGLVIDQVNNFAQSVNVIFSRPVPWAPEVQTNREHPISKNIPRFYAPFSSPLELDPSGHDNLRYETLGQTSEQSWTETDENQLLSGQIAQDPSVDPVGSQIVAASVSGKFTSTFNQVSRPPAVAGKHTETSEEEGRLIVYSSAQMLTNDFLGAGANINMALNSLDWLSQDDALINIRAKDVQTRELNADLSKSQISTVRYLNILLMPLLVIIFGLIWWQIRKKQSIKL